MQNQVPSVQSGRKLSRLLPDGATRIALDENELAARWGLSGQNPAPAGGRNSLARSSASSVPASPT